jgi:glycosyltransferase involved in cell wall biosynthesis
MPDPVLTIYETHPVQYHAPVYRAVAERIPVHVVYGSDFSVTGYRDREFGTSFAWDVDLLSGYSHEFLKSGENAPKTYEDVTAQGLTEALAMRPTPRCHLVVGYSSAFDRGVLDQVKNRREPLLIRAETTDHAFKRSLWKSLARDAVLRLLYKKMDRVLFIGMRSRQHYQRLGVPDDKLIASPYCVNEVNFQRTEEHRQQYRAASRTEWNVAADDVVLLFSGKLVERKGVSQLPDAALALAQAAKRKVHLVLLGDGDQRDSVLSLARSRQVTVIPLGFQPQSKLSSFYHAADVCILPSIAGETWGLVVNEALLHGIPVVASDMVGSVDDLLRSGETGEVFATGLPDSLQQAMTRVAGYIGTELTRNSCRAKAAEYSTTRAAEGIIEAYRAVVGR